MISMIKFDYHTLKLTTLPIVKLTQKKNKGSQEIMIFDWEIQLEKV